MPARPRVVLQNRLARVSRMQMLQTNAVSGWYKKRKLLNDTFACVLNNKRDERNFGAGSALRHRKCR